MNTNFAAIGLLVWSACGVVGRGEAKRDWEDATVFAGPDGGRFAPPAGSVAKVHVAPDRATFWKTHGALVATVREARALVLFAGVTRTEGNGKPWTEAQKKSLWVLDGEWFRTGGQPIPAEWAEQVRSAVFDGVREWKGRKLCGGFHADVLLKWQGGPLAADTDALICFGCGEVKIYGATGSLYGDLAPEQAKRLREWLAPRLADQSANGRREERPTPPVRR